MELLCNILLILSSLKSLSVGFNPTTNENVFRKLKKEHFNKLLDIN